MNISALSSSAPMSMPNRFKYNGNEEQTDFGWDIYDFNARLYNADLGRFMGVDALSDLQNANTPYHFAYNSPIALNDPSGLMPGLIISYSGDETNEAQEYQFQNMSDQDRFELAKSLGQDVTNSFNDGIDPIDPILKNYGFESKMKQLYPEKNGFQKGSRVLDYITAIFDPTSPWWLSVPVEIGTDLAATDYYNLEGVQSRHANSYKNNLVLIEQDLILKIAEINDNVTRLRENNVTGFNNQEIASQIRYRWELKEDLILVGFELEEINERISKGFIQKAGG